MSGTSIPVEKLKEEWDVADRDKSGTLDLKEIVKLLDHMNLRLKEKEVKKKFKEVDLDGNGSLNFKEFSEFLEQLNIRGDIAAIFAKHSTKDVITAEKFAEFLKDVQREPAEDCTLDKAKEIIKKFTSGEEFLDESGFSRYLSSTYENGPFAKHAKSVYQDMTQPFAHYYIASSHNTYLLADQLKGESSVEAYKNALERGCRCVELDCWDGPNNVPIIYHGHTLTSKILFEDVLVAVRDFGFKVSQYPIILSLEVHCSVEGQKAMAELVKKVLGTAGLLPDQPGVANLLPAPGALLNKVLLKGKMVPFKDEDFEKEQEQGSKSKKAAAPAVEHIAKELSDLVHLKATGFKSFEIVKESFKPWDMSSFSEEKVEFFGKKNAGDFIEYNTRNLSRIFPKGTRFDSSNYDPVPAWNHGAQIVALNYQTASEPMFINDGKFIDNGRAGYVLKPQYFRSFDPKFNPAEKFNTEMELIVEVISGWNLPKSMSAKSRKGEIIDPYVKVKVVGIKADCGKGKTSVIRNNGYNPNWNKELRFSVRKPELAILLFVVADSDYLSPDDLIGQYALPLTCLREGYRSIPLKGKKGESIEPASLLVRFRLLK
eukprot:TRINITY_DN2369_c0_g1_i1.p1 TRINITY_DN2369_c0_g1~~TRINITY_DN2369_c0_g1_i1.p1  ORF type:complete len:599 (+),score=252.39 TRINITY_DN2369_c0_g1_i1:142-1938(+)